MEPESTTSSVTVDEDGDLILLIGTEAQTRILVSSKVLTISSKVFEAILSKSFKEAHELAASANSNQIYELPLPDDDVWAMIILCRVVHHQARVIAVGTVTMALLERLVIITDKYACANAVSFASRSWLEKYGNGSGDYKLVTISYLLDNAEVFRNASRRVLMKSEGDTIRAKVDSDIILPDRLFDQLETKRFAANNTISRLIAEELDAMQQGSTYLESAHGRCLGNGELSSTYSQHDAGRVQAFTKKMREEVKWPLEFHRRSLDDTFTSLRVIASSIMSIAGAKDPNNAGCKACKITVQDQAHSIIVKATDLIEGLCLDCVQAPEGQGKDCRVRHGEL